MSKTLKKFKNQYDIEERHHDAKRKKLLVKNKQIKNIDRVLKSNDLNKILKFEET